MGTKSTMKTLLILALVVLLISNQSIAQNVGIGSTSFTPNTSAGLEIQFNNKGLLVPRIALTGVNDLTTIPSPATSLLVFNTTVGSGLVAGYYYNAGTPTAPSWKRLITTSDIVTADGSETIVTAGTNVTIAGSGTTASPYVINASGGGSTNDFYLGQDTLGGIVFYIYLDQNGDQHGLIVSKTETFTSWQSISSPTFATRSWDGVYNTNLMINSPARTWVIGLGSGWYLPSIDELSILWHNRFYANKGLNDAGATLLSNTSSYWSSTEHTVSSAFIITFSLGSASNNVNKTNGYGVRAVRAF